MLSLTMRAASLAVVLRTLKLIVCIVLLERSAQSTRLQDMMTIREAKHPSRHRLPTFDCLPIRRTKPRSMTTVD